MKSVCFRCHKNPCECTDIKLPPFLGEDAPTNEPKMPEVIYAYISTARHRGEWFKDEPKDHHKSFYSPYHHDDKVQELKDALRDLMEIIKNEYHFRTPDKWDKITKASNLLK